LALTKSDIIERVSETIDLSGTEAKDTVEELLEIIKYTLATGEDIMISGFGRFQVNEKAPRKGRNPATGEDMMLDGRKTVTFKCSGTLRDHINETVAAEMAEEKNFAAGISDRIKKNSRSSRLNKKLKTTLQPLQL